MESSEKKKNYTKKLIYRTGTDSQTQKICIQVISLLHLTELHTWPSAGRGGNWDSTPDLMLSQTPKQQRTTGTNSRDAKQLLRDASEGDMF